MVGDDADKSNSQSERESVNIVENEHPAVCMCGHMFI